MAMNSLPLLLRRLAPAKIAVKAQSAAGRICNAASGIYYQRTRLAPQVKPPPSASISTKCPVRMRMRRQHAAAVAAALRNRFQHDRTGAVAEQHAGATIGPVEDAREGLGANHQRSPRLAEAQRVVRDREREDEAGADRLHIEG